MRNLSIVPLLVLLLISSLAAAQTEDWQVVENLKPRTLISVQDKHHVIHDSCRFRGVVDSQLFCEYGSHPFGPSEIVFRQESIRAVRREHNSALIGLTAGAGAGAIIGASREPYPGIGRGGSALLGAALLGGVGVIVGSATGHFSHGKVIYRNPHDKPQLNSAPQTRDGDSDDEITPIVEIASARGPYVERPASDENDPLTLAQFSRRRPGRPLPRRGAYPGPSSSGRWTPEGNGHHAAIGALIGFGVGAAAGAKGNTDASNRVTAILLVGSVGALLGAMIGDGIPSFHARHRHAPSWPDEDDVASRGKPSNSHSASQNSARPSANRPPAVPELAPTLISSRLSVVALPGPAYFRPSGNE